jgi:hypothetical protein
MKTRVVNLFRILTVLLFTLSSVSYFAQSRKKAKADRDTKEWRYEVHCAGVGVEGTKLIKVFSYSKKPIIAIEQAKKNAIHGLIFKGFNGNSMNGCPTQKPLTNNPLLEVEQSAFFNDFFADGGRYMKFVSITGDGAIDPQDRIKVGRQYKIGVIVSVRYDLLRKDLENAGVIKELSSGF